MIRISCLFAITVLLTVGSACRPTPSIDEIRQMQARGGYPESIEPLRSRLRGSPGDSEAQLLLGIALRRSGAPSLAIWPLTKASEDPDRFMDAAMELGLSALAAGNRELAIRTADRILAREERHPDALLLRAEARITNRGDYDEALADAEAALELEPDSYPGFLTKASVLLRLGRSEEAESAIDELERLAHIANLGREETARLCVVKATLSDESGDRALAQERLAACLATSPADYNVIEGAVTLYDRWGRSEISREVLARAVEIEPDVLPYRIALAGRLRAVGREDEAQAVLREVTRSEHDVLAEAGWIALADHFLALERHAEAAESLERALELNPDPEVVLVLAYADLLAMAGDNDGARAAAQRLERQEFRDLVEGRVLLNDGRPEEALTRFERALKVWPDNAAARYYAARAAEQKGDFHRAIEEYRHSLRSDAAFTDAGLRLARLHLARGGHDAALRAAKHHVDAHPDDVAGLLLIGRIALTTRQAISQQTLARLWAPAVRGRWASLQADVIAERQGSEAAVAFLEAASQVDLGRPEEASALRSLVRALLDAGRPEEARTQLDRWLSARDSSIHAELRAAILESEGNVAGAKAALERAIDLDPENEAAWVATGRLAAATGAVESAVAAFDRAAALALEPWIPHREAVLALERAGLLDRARARLERLLREYPADTESILLLGRICLHLDSCRGAVPALARQAAELGAAGRARELRDELVRADRRKTAS